MAIQNRRGNYKDFNPSKMLPGEFAVVTDGSNKLFICFNSQNVKEIALQSQIPTNNNQLKNGADYATNSKVNGKLDSTVDSMYSGYVLEVDAYGNIIPKAKPQINGIELKGNITSKQLGIPTVQDVLNALPKWNGGDY